MGGPDCVHPHVEHGVYILFHLGFAHRVAVPLAVLVIPDAVDLNLIPIEIRLAV